MLQTRNILIPKYLPSHQTILEQSIHQISTFRSLLRFEYGTVNYDTIIKASEHVIIIEI